MKSFPKEVWCASDKMPGCSLLNSFDSDSFGTVTILQRSASTCEATNDTIRTECALGRTEFSQGPGLDGHAVPVEIPKHFASNIRAASDLLGSNRVDLVLSHTYRSDGTGLGLLAPLAHLPVMSAFLCLPVENSFLWLPVIDGGTKCLGLPALRPLEFTRTLEEMARCLSTRTQACCPRVDDLIVVDRDCA